ncbi:MAG: type IV pilus secretin PilQ [Thermodesulfovibrionia bacterium]
MTFRRTLLFFIFIFIVYTFSGVNVNSEAQQPGTPEITGIRVEVVNNTTEIHIESNQPFSYTIYKPADPYRLVVELQEVNLGKFKEKMVIDRAGVMEIVPSKIEGSENVKLEILLTVPAEIKPVSRGSALILAFYNLEAEETVLASGEQPPPLAEEELKKAGVIENIELTKTDDGVVVVISGDGKMYPEVFQLDSNKLVVDIPDVSTKVVSPKVYEPPVLGIRAGEMPGKTRIVFDLADSTKHDISAKGKQVILSFSMPVPEMSAEETETLVFSEESLEPASPDEDEAGAGVFASKYTGEKISIDFQDADLVHIFRLIADISGYNIVVSPKVKGKFSMKLTNVPWDHALDIILRNYGLSKAVEENIIRIAPTSVIAREEEEIAKAKEAREKSGNLITVIYPINFADVEDIEDAIKDAKILTKRGFVGVDERTSSVIIKDVESKHNEYRALIEELDKPTRQVAIEAKIVEVTTNFTRDLGIQWGVLWKPTPQIQIGGTGAGGSGIFSGNPLLVDLPAAVGAGAGGALGFGFVSARDLRALDIQLSAMESSGKGRIISNPKIITMDNQQANIQQGKKIPYQETAEGGGTTTAFVTAALELTVTPHITPDGTIVMDIEIKKNEADFSQTSAGGAPTIDTNEASTQVLISDGDTLVMGGIFKTNTAESTAGVPLLSKVPVLGWLFKKRNKIDTTTELLIFITPRIIK